MLKLVRFSFSISFFSSEYFLSFSNFPFSFPYLNMLFSCFIIFKKLLERFARRCVSIYTYLQHSKLISHRHQASKFQSAWKWINNNNNEKTTNNDVEGNIQKYKNKIGNKYNQLFKNIFGRTLWFQWKFTKQWALWIFSIK